MMRSITMIDPITGALGVLFIGQLYLLYKIIPEYKVHSLVRQEVKDIKDKILKELTEETLNKTAEMHVENYLCGTWFGWGTMDHSEGSRVSKEISSKVADLSESYIKEQVSSENFIDSVVSKLNNKQIKGK